MPPPVCSAEGCFLLRASNRALRAWAFCSWEPVSSWCSSIGFSGWLASSGASLLRHRAALLSWGELNLAGILQKDSWWWNTFIQEMSHKVTVFRVSSLNTAHHSVWKLTHKMSPLTDLFICRSPDTQFSKQPLEALFLHGIPCLLH